RFSEANSWFETGESAAFCIPDKARIATFITPTTVIDDKPTAFFGYWETHGDDRADATIFEAAEAWAKERGARYLCGPINFSTYSNYRLRLAAHDGGYTFAGEPFNPKTYPKILEGLGFSQRSIALAQITTGQTASQLGEERDPIIRKVLDAGYRIEPLTHRVWLDNVPSLHGLIDEMFSKNFAYTPLSYAAFEQMCSESFIRRADPRASTIAYAPDGSIAGFLLVYPHYGPLIVQSAGNDRVPVSALSYEEHFPRLQEHGRPAAIMKTGATVPAHREAGIFHALGIASFQAVDGVYDSWFAAIIRTTNPSRRCGDGVVDDSRWYALFGKDLHP
ncbi:MAG: hypothetical protein ACNA8W_09075, partial [Bradymonadaceae bacterium]